MSTERDMFSMSNEMRNLYGEEWVPKEGGQKKMTIEMTIIKLDAGHDKNGNPRRAYVAYSSGGEIYGAWNEGYSGYKAVPEELQRDAQRAICIPTTYTYYREMLKHSR